MKTPQEIIEARWPGWIAEYLSGKVEDVSIEDVKEIPILDLIAEGQREALEFAAQAAEIEDDGEEVARICRAKAAAL